MTKQHAAPMVLLALLLALALKFVLPEADLYRWVIASSVCTGAAGFGLGAARCFGKGAPIIEEWAIGGANASDIGRLALALALGALAGVILMAAIQFAPCHSPSHVDPGAHHSIPLWRATALAFSSAVIGEILFRLFVVSAAIWALAGGWKTQTAGPMVTGLGIAAGAVISGLTSTAWLTATGSALPQTLGIDIVAAGAGVMFGVIYWRGGVEAAILAHFGCELVLLTSQRLSAGGIFNG